VALIREKPFAQDHQAPVEAAPRFRKLAPRKGNLWRTRSDTPARGLHRTPPKDLVEAGVPLPQTTSGGQMAEFLAVGGLVLAWGSAAGGHRSYHAIHQVARLHCDCLANS